MIIRVLKWVWIAVFSINLTGCGMSEQDKLELERLRQEKLVKDNQAQQDKEHQVQIERDRLAQIERDRQAQVERDRLSAELAEKERQKKESEELERQTMEKIHNSLAFDVKGALNRKDVCTDKIESVNGNVTVNDRNNENKYFVASVSFSASCDLLLMTHDKTYVGKWYYKKNGDYNSAEWKRTSSDYY